MTRSPLFVIILFFPLLGCNGKEGPSSPSDHVFKGVVPCLEVQCTDVNPDGSTSSGSGSGGSSFVYGITTTVIRGVESLSLFIPEGNVQINETPLFRTISGFATPNTELTITISFTFFSQASLPRTFRLVAGPPQGVEEAGLMYSEGVSGSAPQAITQVVSGSLILNSFSSTFVEGAFSGELRMSNNQLRSLVGGTIRLRRIQGG